MSCCGGNRSPAVQALTPMREPPPSGDQRNVQWTGQPSGMTKYVMRSGNSYLVFRRGAVVTVYEVDLPELRERGLIA